MLIDAKDVTAISHHLLHGYWMATGGVEAFLAVIPETVAGLARLELRTNEVHYEGDSVIRVMLSGAQLQPTSALAGW